MTQGHSEEELLQALIDAARTNRDPPAGVVEGVIQRCTDGTLSPRARLGRSSAELLEVAVRLKDDGLVQAVLAAGGRVERGRIMRDALALRPRTFRALVASGGDVNYHDSVGSLLHHLAEADRAEDEGDPEARVELARFLLERGVDPLSLSDSKTTAIAHARDGPLRDLLYREGVARLKTSQPRPVLLGEPGYAVDSESMESSGWDGYMNYSNADLPSFVATSDGVAVVSGLLRKWMRNSRRFVSCAEDQVLRGARDVVVFQVRSSELSYVVEFSGQSRHSTRVKSAVFEMATALGAAGSHRVYAVYDRRATRIVDGVREDADLDDPYETGVAADHWSKENGVYLPPHLWTTDGYRLHLFVPPVIRQEVKRVDIVTIPAMLKAP